MSLKDSTPKTLGPEHTYWILVMKGQRQKKLHKKKDIEIESCFIRYEMFELLNQEFSFEVDVSNLPCGLNGALYFVAMDADGGKVSRCPSTIVMDTLIFVLNKFF